MTLVRFPNRVLGPIERLVAALTDPARRDRTVIAVLVAYVLIWTLYAVIAKASQGVHFDMAESFALWHEPGFGYKKHPPLAVVISGVWFSVFPVADWSFYLLSMSVVGIAFWTVWKLCGDYLDGEKRVVALALLMLVPFFNFHALKYNNNTILIPLWSAATLFFLRSFEHRRVLDAALAGAAAAGAMYGKYWSAMLLVGLGIAALVDHRRMYYFRSTAPWITIAVGALLLAPNVYLVVASNFAPMEYAYGIHGARSMAKALASAGGYLAASFGYVAVALIVAFLATRPSRAAILDSIWPSDDHRRLAAVAFWAALLVPIPFALATHVELTGLWTMASWSLLPVVLLSSPLVKLPRLDAVRVTAFAAIFPVVMVTVAPAIAFVTHRTGFAAYMLHSAPLAPLAEIGRAAFLRLSDLRSSRRKAPHRSQAETATSYRCRRSKMMALAFNSRPCYLRGKCSYRIVAALDRRADALLSEDFAQAASKARRPVASAEFSKAFERDPARIVMASNEAT